MRTTSVTSSRRISILSCRRSCGHRAVPTSRSRKAKEPMPAPAPPTLCTRPAPPPTDDCRRGQALAPVPAPGRSRSSKSIRRCLQASCKHRHALSRSRRADDREAERRRGTCASLATCRCDPLGVEISIRSSCGYGSGLPRVALVFGFGRVPVCAGWTAPSVTEQRGGTGQSAARFTRTCKPTDQLGRRLG